jgi:hypothetical protein
LAEYNLIYDWFIIGSVFNKATQRFVKMKPFYLFLFTFSDDKLVYLYFVFVCAAFTNQNQFALCSLIFKFTKFMTFDVSL